jgi:hypothetical protein
MKKMMLAVVAVAGLAAAGCVSTVNQGHEFAMWPQRDQFEQQYPRTVDQVYLASVKVVNADGALVSEFTPHDSTNVIRSLQGRVNNRDVFIRVQAAGQTAADLTVQARTGHGTADIDLAHKLSTEITVELTQVH